MNSATMKENPSQEDFKGFRATFKDEWNSRTWYGRMWFPVWAAFRIILMGSLIVLVLAIAPREILDPVIERSYDKLIAGISWLRSLTPEVYNE